MLFFPMVAGEWIPLRPLTTNGLFESVSRSDAGFYRCTADNGVQPVVHSEFHLQVSGTEPLGSCAGLLELPAKGPVLGIQSK